MTRSRFLAAALLLAALAVPGLAVAQDAPAADPAPSAAPAGNSAAPVALAPPVPFEGRLRVAGSAPLRHAILVVGEQPGAAGEYVLRGPWVAELLALANVRVRVLGSVGAEPEGPTLLRPLVVVSYEIVDVGGGERPWVGWLADRDGTLVLRIENVPDPILLAGAPAHLQLLRAHLGGKVWVTGAMEDGRLRVTRFDVIRRAGH